MASEHGSRVARLALRPLLLAFGAYHLAFGMAAMVAPRAAYDVLATWPPYNDHFLRDIGSFYVALGAVMLIAALRRAWQVPVLALLVVHYALHSISHVVDAGDADETWKGAVTLAFVGGLTVVFAWALRAASRTAR